MNILSYKELLIYTFVNRYCIKTSVLHHFLENGDMTSFGGIGVAKYRRKPIVVEAVKITTAIKVETEHGTLEGNPGDFLVTEQNGRQYPVTAESFHKTYEPVSGSFNATQFVKKVLRKIKYKVKEIAAKS